MHIGSLRRHGVALLVCASLVALTSRFAFAAQDPDPTNPTGAFLAAITEGDEKAVSALLASAPGLVSIADEYGRLPLPVAVQSDDGHDERWVRIAKLLLEHGSDAKAVDDYRQTPLHDANSKAMAELLLAHGAKVDAENLPGETPLFGAAVSEHADVVEVLLAHGANIDHRDREGLSAVDRAAQRYHAPMVALLAARGAAGGKLLVAVQADDAQVVDELLAGPAEIASSTKSMALLVAAHERRAAIARALVRAHVDPNGHDLEGYGPLYHAVNNDDVELARMLLDGGAKVNSYEEGLLAFIDNPLRIAVINKSEKMVELLLSRGATTHDLERVEMDGSSGPSVLEMAVEDGSLAIAKLLLEHGVPPDDRDGSGSDPLAVAARVGNTAAVELLLAHGADPATSAALDAAVDRHDAAMIDFLLAHGFAAKPGASVRSAPLHAAVRMKDRATLESLLARGFDPNQLDSGNASALDVAVEVGDMELIQFLLDHGAPAEPTKQHDVGPLHVAARQGNRAAAELLLARGADLARLDDNGDSALDAAAERGDLAMVELLLARGAKIRPADAQNGGTLHKALSGNASVVELLLSRGADPSRVDRNGYALLDGLTEPDDRAMRELLIAHGAVPAMPHRDVLLQAVSSGDVATLRAFLPVDHDALQAQEDDGATLLHLAARAGQAEIARALITAGAEIDARDTGSQTPLHFAAFKSKEVTQALIDAGASADATDGWGQTPLCWAKDAEVARLLIAHGALIERFDGSGSTPLMCMARDGRVDAMRELLAHGAKIDARNDAEVTALDVAARAQAEASVSFLCAQHAAGGELVLAMQSRDAAAIKRVLGGSTAIPESTKATALFMAVQRGRTDLATLMLAAHANVGGADGKQRTPLHVAVAANNAELVKLLLENGAQADAEDEDNDTPLRSAAKLERRDLIELMLAHGADIDALALDQPTDGLVTPLVEAIQRGSSAFVEFLLAHGASADGTGHESVSPLQLAVARGDASLIELLISRGAQFASDAALSRFLLDSAVDRGRVDLARVLLEHGAKPNEPDKAGRRPLDRAEQARATEMIAVLRAHGAYNETVIGELFAAISHGSEVFGNAKVAELLDAAPELIKVVRDGDTPLLAAVKHADFFTFSEVVHHRPDPNVTDAQGVTPLFLAVRNRLFAGLIMTLAPNVNALNGPHRQTALMAAVQGHGEDPLAVVDSLIRAGAEVGATDDQGSSALHYAAQYGDAGIVALLVSKGAQPNAHKPDALPPLWTAAFTKNSDTLQALVRAGADLNALAGDPPVPALMYACAGGNVEVERILIRAGANVNAAQADGITALHVAAIAKDSTSVTVLLDAGANVNIQTQKGATPLDMTEDDAMRELLRSRGGLTSGELP